MRQEDCIVVPASFRRKATRTFGDLGESWTKDLPRILRKCQDRWRLSECRPVRGLSINLVCYAQSELFGDVVLKIQGPHSERDTEITSLELYQGAGACKCYAFDRELSAMVLERLRPGHTLRTIPSPDEQLEIGIQMLRDLPLPVSMSHGLPTYGDWMSRAFHTIRSRYEPGPAFRSLMDFAQDVYAEVDGAGRYLLHGDLHHDNILADGSHGWKVIDPQGVIGSRVLESGRFIQNHAIGEGPGLRRDRIRHTIERVSAKLAESPRTVAVALFIMHVLSMCWGYEMHYSARRLSLMLGQCIGLLDLVRSPLE